MTSPNKDASRRAFLTRLRGQPGKRCPDADNRGVIRPPWAKRVPSECTACGDCAPSCSEGIIAFDDAGYPVIDFSKGACTFCGACAEACQADVFDPPQSLAWQLDVSVSSDCFAEKGIYCRSCGDVCPERAIRIVPQLGGRARVVIDDEACTGCGACFGACPATAISITQAQEHASG